MIIPPIADPQLYAGLYIYDFGSHVSVGYTAVEIRILRESEEYRNGTVYEIYRVTEEGRFELRAISDDRLGALDALAFLRHDAADAKKDYEMLVDAARKDPAPCSVELIHARIYSFDPPNVMAVIYPAAATAEFSAWLQRNGPDLGDRIVAGAEAYADIAGSQNLRITSCKLPTRINLTDRSPEEIFAAIDQPIQR